MRIAFGNNQYREEVILDLEKEDIHFVLLIGREGAGKTFFHRRIYHDLVLSHLPATLKFLFLDPPGSEAKEWAHSPYLLSPVITDPALALDRLEQLARESEEKKLLRAAGSQTIIVHIEDGALVQYDRQRLEQCFDRILAHRKTNQVYIFYSTSVVDRSYLDYWLERYVDLRVIFQLKSRSDAEYLAGGPLHFAEPGEHLLVWRGKTLRCFPFLKES